MTLQLEKVSKRVGAEKHLYDIDLSLAHGSLNVLLGPTIAGKTSLMRLMAGLDRPTSGRLLLDGQEITGMPVRKRSVAMVYQEFINYPSLTVYNNIASPLRRAGVAKDEIDRKVRQAAGALDIDDLLERLPSELSGGQQQRTALARALVKKAELLLLDEPLVNLDYKLREQLRDAPHSWLECHTSPYRQNSALYPVIEMLEGALDFGDEDTSEQKLERLERGLAHVGLELNEAIPLFASLLSLRLSDRYAPLEITPQLQRQRTFETLLA